jgi:hypothetical protein
MFLLELPLWAALIVLLVFSIVVSYSGLKLVHKFYQYEHLKETHELSGYIFNAYGLLYAVVIAFVVYINWGEYNEAQRQVYVETNQMSNIFHNAQGFDDSLKINLMKAVTNYAESVMTDDFAAMKKLNRSAKTREAYDKLWDVMLKADTGRIKNPKVYEMCLDELNQLSEARRLRYLYMENTIPTVIWVIMIVGCLITMCFAYLFGMKNKNPYIFFVIAFTYINILMLYLILVLDYPFTGYNTISNEPYLIMINHFKDVMGMLK